VLIGGGADGFQCAAEDVGELLDLRFGDGCGWDETQDAAVAAEAQDDAALETDAAGSRLARSRTSSMPISWPRPRTSPIIS